MAARRAEIEANPLKKLYLWHQARKLRRLERELCHQFDVNLTVSELDSGTLRVSDPHAHCHVVENGTDTEYFHPSDGPPEPNTLIFAGGLNWYPNVSGIRFFARQIWPLLKQKCPGIRLYLAGRSPVAEIVRLAKSDPTIELIADPPDIRPWVWKAAVYVCPIIDGGGTRLKILDALAMGKAVVSTSVGGEGLQVKHGEDILVADSPKDFASHVLHLLEHETSRKQLGARGRALVERLYSWEVIGRHLEDGHSCALDRGGCGR
jgi:glycosyltransferase involved in cell wall biosynthesis